MGMHVSDLTSIQSYSNWASRASADQVAGQKGNNVNDLSKVTSGLARLFHFKSVDAARLAALDGFKQALTKEFGTDIANSAWQAATNGVAVKGLTAELVNNTLALANRFVAELHTQLQPNVNVKDLPQMATQDVMSAVLKFGGNAISQQKCEIMVTMAKADALLGMTPASQPECNTLINNLSASILKLNDLRQGAVSQEDADKIQSQIDKLQEKKTDIEAFRAVLPGSDTAIKGMASHWKDALNLACEKAKAAATPDQLATLEKGLTAVKDKYDDETMLAALKKKKKDVHKPVQTDLENCIKSAFGGTIPKNIARVLDKVVKNCESETLNKAEWKKIENKFVGTLNSKSITFESDITSGRHISECIGDDYEEGVNAYNCHHKDTANAVNLATSKLQITGADGKKHTVFSGVRHGVHSSEGKIIGKDGKVISNKDANIKRAQQTVKAAFVSYLENHAVGNTSRDKPFSFNMTSLSLLTPSNEGDMIKDQVAAYQAVNGKTLTVNVNGKDYTIKPNILMFNYGVNFGAVRGFGILGGWEKVNNLNSSAMKALAPRVEAFIAQCQDPKTKNAVETLFAQIKDIDKHLGARNQNHEAYKMPARLAVLTYLMGDVPLWNCKSGKDRTGMLDVEAKFLATLIDQGLPIPQPGARLTREQSQLLRTIAMRSGSLEMQAYNTGVAGYKLDGVDSIYERMSAGSAEKATLMGGSGYAGS